jgi:hypothetical protein
VTDPDAVTPFMVIVPVTTLPPKVATPEAVKTGKDGVPEGK